MIDKNGKVFGKINIIDLLVLLILVVAIAVVGVKFITPGDTELQTLEMEFYTEEVNDWVAEKINPGDVLYDGTYDLKLGTVVKAVQDEPMTWGLTQEGQYVLAPRDGYCSLTVIGEVQGVKTANGAEIDGNMYGVGHSMVLYAGDAKMYLRVSDIRVKGETNAPSGVETPEEAVKEEETVKE